MCDVFVAVESWNSRDCVQQQSAFSLILLQSLQLCIAIKKDWEYTCCKPVSLSVYISVICIISYVLQIESTAGN